MSSSVPWKLPTILNLTKITVGLKVSRTKGWRTHCRSTQFIRLHVPRFLNTQINGRMGWKLLFGSFQYQNIKNLLRKYLHFLFTLCTVYKNIRMYSMHERGINILISFNLMLLRKCLSFLFLFCWFKEKLKEYSGLKCYIWILIRLNQMAYICPSGRIRVVRQFSPKFMRNPVPKLHSNNSVREPFSFWRFYLVRERNLTWADFTADQLSRNCLPVICTNIYQYLIHAFRPLTIWCKEDKICGKI
jgi:hypothetical protein